jgi:hypothetical protein
MKRLLILALVFAIVVPDATAQCGGAGLFGRLRLGLFRPRARVVYQSSGYSACGQAAAASNCGVSSRAASACSTPAFYAAACGAAQAAASCESSPTFLTLFTASEFQSCR